MEKKYTLDTKLNEKDLVCWEVDEPITSMRILKTALRTNVYRAPFEDVVYLIAVEDDYTEVLVDINCKYGEQKGYYFDDFEEALNAHLVVTNPDLVVGDIIMYYNDSYEEK